MVTRKKGKKFEEAVERLEEIVAKMESGELSLDDSIDIYKEGMDLVAFCNSRLDEAEEKINIIVKTKNGKITERELEPQEEL
ncbi:MAG: exodeoxyribonuclease VII small subunit [Clostridium sp.]